MPSLNVLLLRHGKTAYTDIFPDLTQEGIDHVRRVANTEIRPWVETQEHLGYRIHLMTSPAPRAHGTAHVVAKEVGLPDPFFDPALRPMDQRDVVGCRTALGTLSGRGYINYETEPVFRDASLFEQPQEIRRRFYDSIIQWTHRFGRNQERSALIIVSHYETLCALTEELFFVTATETTALRHAETISLSIHTSDRDGLYVVCGEFRGIRSTGTLQVSNGDMRFVHVSPLCPTS